MTKNTVTVIDYRGRRYGIVTHENKIGVCSNGYGRIKYMPVIYNYGFHFLPKLLRSPLIYRTTLLHDLQ